MHWHAGDGINSDKFAQNIIEVSAVGTTYKAGDGIDSDKFAQNIIEVSSKGTTYKGGDGIKIENDVISVSSKYLSANALNEVSAIWNQVSAISGYGYSAWSAASALSATSGYGYSAWSAISGFKITSDTTDILTAYKADDDVWHVSAKAYQTYAESYTSTFTTGYITGNGTSEQNAVRLTEMASDAIDVVTANSATWASAQYIPTLSAAIDNKQDKGNYLTADALNDVSAVWNEVSAISGYGYSAWSAVSAEDFSKYVTSSTNDITGTKAYVLAKDGENVAWSGLDVSTLGKTYDVLSETTSLINVTTATNNGTTTFTISVKDVEPVISDTVIHADNGISAELAEDGTTWNIGISAAELSAGDWIDSDKLNENIISVSGWSALEALSPLYFTAHDDHVAIGIDDYDVPEYNKAALIINGFGENATDYIGTEDALHANYKANDMDDYYEFTFGREMNIHIDINARFVAQPNKSDYMCDVGFACASAYDADGNTLDTQATNEIKYTMLGACSSQNYNASTIAHVPDNVKRMKFKFIVDKEMIARIEDPCITVHEI